MRPLPLLLLIALFLAGCNSPMAPVAVELSPAAAPQMAPRGDSEPTAAVQVSQLEAKIVENAHWWTEGTDERGFAVRVPASGPAIEFTADLDLHGWTLDEFNGSRPFHSYRWHIGVSVDSEGPGAYDGLWDYDSGFWYSGLGTAITVHDREDENYERETHNVADFTMYAVDQDGLTGRAGVRFSIPLEHYGLERGPVRWKLSIPDDYHFAFDQYIGITDDSGTRVERVR